MPSYKLTYFKARGAVEVSRFIMAYGGIEYEDIRLEGAEWQELKPKTPYGALPIFEVDGDMICQSKTISRFLATKTGLMGSSDWEAAKINMVVDCVTDFMKPMFAYFYEKNENTKKEMLEKIQTSLPNELKKFENLIPADSKHFVGNKMSWADMELTYVVTMLPMIPGLTVNWNEVPKLEALKNTVESHPKIAEWIAKRPKTER